MCTCVNIHCGKKFEEDKGFNPFYCSGYCAQTNNGGPAVLSNVDIMKRSLEKRKIQVARSERV